MTDEAARTAGEAKALNDIERYGLHVLHVLPEDDRPNFSYSIGIEATLKMPEAIVIGLRPEVAQYMINEFYRKAKAGENVGAGALVADLIDGFECRMSPVDATRFRAAFGWASWLHGGKPFRVLQIVYPDLDGRWPEDPEVDPALHLQQPILENPGVVFP